VPVSDAGTRIAAREAQLIAQLADGTIEQPMKELCRRYEKDLYRFGVHFLSREEMAEILVQETFQRLCHGAGQYDPRRASPGAFLFGIARAVALGLRERPDETTPAGPDPAVRRPLPPDGIGRILDALAVRDRLGQLSSPHADQIRLALDERLTQSQVARRLEVPEDVVITRTFHGLQALRSTVASGVTMPAERKAGRAHAAAADWLLGTTDAAQSAEFEHHASSCEPCRAAAATFGYLGQLLRELPPAVEPPPDLAARTIAAVLDAPADGDTQTGLRSAPAARSSLPPSQLASRYRPSPGTGQRPVPAEGPLGAAGKGRPRRRRATQYVTAAAAVALAGAGFAVLPGLTGGTAADPPAGGAAQPAARAALKQAGAAGDQAAAWVASEVSASAILACDPVMCSVLVRHGVPAPDLLVLRPGAAVPLGSALVVATAAVRAMSGARLAAVYAPQTLASFGSGAARIDVRVVAPDGAPAYRTALAAGLRARRAAGLQQLADPRISALASARTQLADGSVDGRLLITLAALAGAGPVRIIAFAGEGPGSSSGTPLRTVELAAPEAAAQAMLAFVCAQRPPYRPARADLSRGPGGQWRLTMQFTAPSPLGLLPGQS
jgi:DNA-directed RNA polymerase specialized sigma24 family protein